MDGETIDKVIKIAGMVTCVAVTAEWLRVLYKSGKKNVADRPEDKPKPKSKPKLHVVEKRLG